MTEHPLRAYTADDPAPRDYWYFTFGLDHPLAKRYVILLGTHEETRQLMTAIFGQGNWAEQYTREKGRADRDEVQPGQAGTGALR